MSNELMIEARGLSKYYKNFTAIKDVSFSIPKGQVVAFLGPNGAGKSTTMKILTGYIAPSEGDAFIAGHNTATDRIAAASKLGYLPENGPLYLDSTPYESLHFTASMHGLKGDAIYEAIERVMNICQLEEVIEKPIGKLSKGFRQRVGMAQTLIHDPDVIVMDEPTSGLDPNQIRTVRKTLRELGKTKTLLLSTHILQEVEAVADRVIFISEGKIRFDDTIDKFRAHSDKLDDAFHSLSNAQHT